MPKLRRVLIDCSLVDFSRQPTGIPRVVLNYVEVGYQWGQQKGIEVVAVTPMADGLFLYRPVPGRGAPPPVLKAAYSSLDAAVPDAALVGKSSADGAALLGDLSSLMSEIRDLLARRPAAEDAAGGAALPFAQPEPRPEPALTQSVRIMPGPGDLIFCPAYWHDVPPERYQSYSAAGAKIVILVHDILPIVFPRFYNAPWCDDFKRNVIAAHAYADAICTVSVYTKDGLRDLQQRHRLASVPMMTTYNGLDTLADRSELAASQDSKYSANSTVSAQIDELGRYYLMVGSIEPKKGHRPVIRCFEEMWRGGLTSNLVIVGRKGWLEEDAVAAIEGSMFYGTKLFWLSGLDDFELGQMYKGSRALIFASLGEGFGLPMIEAAAYRRPIVAYATPIVQEILGGRARTFGTAAELVACIVAMEQDDPHAAAAAAAASVAWPSWPDYIPRVYDTLRDFFEGVAKLPDVVPLAPSPHAEP